MSVQFSGSRVELVVVSDESRLSVLLLCLVMLAWRFLLFTLIHRINTRVSEEQRDVR